MASRTLLEVQVPEAEVTQMEFHKSAWSHPEVLFADSFKTIQLTNGKRVFEPDVEVPTFYTLSGFVEDSEQWFEFFILLSPGDSMLLRIEEDNDQFTYSVSGKGARSN